MRNLSKVTTHERVTRNRITDLEDARALKRMGLPLTTSVEHRNFSKQYSVLWVQLLKAHNDLITAMLAYRKKSTETKFLLLDAARGELKRAVNRAAKAKLKDEGERTILMLFLKKRAIPFLEFWDDVLDHLKAGETVSFEVSELPLWTDPE